MFIWRSGDKTQETDLNLVKLVRFIKDANQIDYNIGIVVLSVKKRKRLRSHYLSDILEMIIQC